jgi:serine/threonine-protein kinase
MPAMSFREQLLERGIELGDEVGRGATAVVYRAVDRRHDRPVAVKVFRPGVGVELGPDRFLHEIRMAAGLQHPHILPVYDSGAADGVLYYVMPYVEGESLRQRLARNGRLPVDEALCIAREIADALGYAHAHGVVHRDIKPENILLEGRHAVVADFGIALAVGRTPGDGPGNPPGDDGRLTAVGIVVGSPAYMSPEQASGDAAVDGRSDIYSLGCVLYEMVAGEPPFLGLSPRAIVARRFLGPPTPLHQRRAEIPAAVSAAVQKALAVDPAARFERVEDFAAELRAPGKRSRIAELRPARRGGRGLAVFASGLALVAVTLLAGQPPSGPASPLDPRRVAVAALSNETGDVRLSPLGPLVAAWITDRLGRTGTVEVVTSATVVPAQHDDAATQRAGDDPERLHTLAAETRAGTLVTGSYYRGDKGAVEFHVEISDANTGELLRAVGPVVSRGSPERVADELSRAVAGAMDTVIAARHQEPRPVTRRRAEADGPVGAVAHGSTG